MAIYKDPILEKIRSILNQYGPKTLQGRYWLGDPIIVSQKELPAAFISYDLQAVGDCTNAELESRVGIAINVAYDMKRDFNQGLANIEGHMSLVELICGRNADYSIRTDTIMGALRAHQDLDKKLWIDVGTQSEADFGVGLEKRGPGIYTTEGVLRITVINQQLKPEFAVSA